MAFEAHHVVIDSPVNNFATFNPLVPNANLEHGNLKLYSSSANAYAFSNIAVTTGKWYFEYAYTAAPSTNGGGGITFDSSFGTSPENNGTRYIPNYGYVYLNGNNVAHADTYTTGDVIGVFVDTDEQKVMYFKNEVPWVSINDISSLGSVPFYFYLYNYIGTQHGNFGQNPSFGGHLTGGGGYPDANGIGQFNYPFAYDYGALALCTENLPEGPIKLSQDQTPSDNFKAVTWLGQSQADWDGTTGTVECDFQPDLVWWKNRDYGHDHGIIDSVRGPNVRLYPSYNSRNYTGSSNLVTSFEPTGFKIGNEAGINNSSYNYIAWVWKAAGSPSSGQAKIIEEDGTQADTTCAALSTGLSITPDKISANRQNGFSIIKWDGGGSGGDTYAHGLSKAPEFFITKVLNADANWIVWSKDANGAAYLDLTDGFHDSRNSWFINSTFPTDTTITTGHQNGGVNHAGDKYITYAWHSVAGYSKCGSFVGNGSTTDGPYVECGFRVSWVMIKQSSSNGNSWWITDSTRYEFNGDTPDSLRANTSDSENTGNSLIMPNYLSNGFKIRGHDSAVNSNGSTYIFMAFAEQPFSAPANAR